LEPGNCFGEKETTRLEVGVLPEALAKKLESLRQGTPYVGLERLQLQDFATEVAGFRRGFPRRPARGDFHYQVLQDEEPLHLVRTFINAQNPGIAFALLHQLAFGLSSQAED